MPSPTPRPPLSPDHKVSAASDLAKRLEALMRAKKG